MSFCWLSSPAPYTSPASTPCSHTSVRGSSCVRRLRIEQDRVNRVPIDACSPLSLPRNCTIQAFPQSFTAECSVKAKQSPSLGVTSSDGCPYGCQCLARADVVVNATRYLNDRTRYTAIMTTDEAISSSARTVQLTDLPARSSFCEIARKLQECTRTPAIYKSVASGQRP